MDTEPSMRREIIVVTGASTGIGAATARELARRGFHVLAGVRQNADADALRDTHIEPVLLDITDAAADATLTVRIADDPERRVVRALVNNAGMAVASRSVFEAIFRRRAASERLSQGSTPSAAGLNTGMRWCERNEVTRSRVQRLPLPVLTPFRLSRPAIRSSLAINASAPTAATTSAGVLLRCPRLRLGNRISL